MCRRLAAFSCDFGVGGTQVRNLFLMLAVLFVHKLGNVDPSGKNTVDLGRILYHGVAQVRTFKDKLLVFGLILVLLNLFIQKVVYSFDQSRCLSDVEVAE